MHAFVNRTYRPAFIVSARYEIVPIFARLRCNICLVVASMPSNFARCAPPSAKHALCTAKSSKMNTVSNVRTIAASVQKSAAEWPLKFQHSNNTTTRSSKQTSLVSAFVLDEDLKAKQGDRRPPLPLYPYFRY